MAPAMAPAMAPSQWPLRNGPFANGPFAMAPSQWPLRAPSNGQRSLAGIFYQFVPFLFMLTSAGDLKENLVNHPAVHVRQAKLSSLMAIGELGMIESQTMQNRRLQIVHMHRSLDNPHAQFV